jgi:hypothetical protein
VAVRGSCDLAAYDSQISSIVTDLQSSIARAQVAPATSVPSASSMRSYPTSSPATGPASTEGAAPQDQSSSTGYPSPLSGPGYPTSSPAPGPASPQGSASQPQSSSRNSLDSALDTAGKLADAVQSLMSKFGNRGNGLQQQNVPAPATDGSGNASYPQSDPSTAGGPTSTQNNQSSGGSSSGPANNTSSQPVSSRPPFQIRNRLADPAPAPASSRPRPIIRHQAP